MMVNDVSNPYSPRENFFLAWGKDANGRWVYVGLDYDETQELLLLQDLALDGDDLLIIDPIMAARTTWSARYLELHDKHEAVRLELCLREAAARRSLISKPH